MSAKIYTDGSCLKNPGGASGWAFVILENDEETYLSGGEASSTNNRMEMMAVIKALSFAPGKEYTIFTDSKLVMNCAQGIWKRKANLDLWSEYDSVSSKFSLKWVWVKAHKGNKYNEIVDDMARSEAKKIKK
jgi:ribonuclease HI